ncbi:hypothetical protein TruAng_009431 [Truncatella angustata]|nr:hypothetical protein TruAng_009431 [Truncatella angustata]
MSLVAQVQTDAPQPQPIQQQASIKALPTNQKDTSSQDAEHKSFWSSPNSPPPINHDNFENPTRVATDIRISLRGPSPEVEQDSEEFRRQSREIKKDIQRMSKYKTKSAQTKIKSQARQEEDERHTREGLMYEHEFRRRMSANEGREFLLDFIQDHFPEHVQNITIRGTKTLEEIKMIGNEDEPSVGVRQCRRLFNAPVMSDQVGLLLWQELRQGDALDHSHETLTGDEAERDGVVLQAVRRRRSKELDRLLTEYIAERRVEREASTVADASLPVNAQQNREVAVKPYLGRTNCNQGPGGRSAMRMPEAMSRVAEQAAACISMEKKAPDGFLGGVKKSAAKGVAQFAAALASGYT